MFECQAKALTSTKFEVSDTSVSGVTDIYVTYTDVKEHIWLPNVKYL